MATHSSILAWKTPWPEEPDVYSPQGCTELDMTEPSQHAAQMREIHRNKKQKSGYKGQEGAGNGNPLQYSSLENPMDRGAWWATVYRITKSRTWMNYLTIAIYKVFKQWMMSV